MKCGWSWRLAIVQATELTGSRQNSNDDPNTGPRASVPNLNTGGYPRPRSRPEPQQASKGEVESKREARVGAMLLPPGHYRFQHQVSDGSTICIVLSMPAMSCAGGCAGAPAGEGIVCPACGSDAGGVAPPEGMPSIPGMAPVSCIPAIDPPIPMSAILRSCGGSRSGTGALSPSRTASVRRAYPVRSPDCAKFVNASCPDGSTSTSNVSAVAMRNSSTVTGCT